MRKRIYLIIPAMCCALVMTPCMAYAGEYTTEVTNNVTLGDVSISLSEYELDEDGKEIPYQNDKQVLPGQTVDKIVRITNNANASWIRVKAEYTSEEGLDSLSDEELTLADGNWEKIGNYYYYKKPVAKDESVDFLKRVKIPASWDSTYAEKGFAIILTADAVQEANFMPDWNASDPWFGTVIETCVHTSYDPKIAGNQAFSVVFENGADGLVKTGEDFFSNWASLMPGDTVSGQVTLKNSYRRTVTMYFKTETIADDAFLKALHLEIKNGDTVIYSGTMDGAVTERVKIASLAMNEEAILTYTVSVPKELNNSYALSKTQTKWIFSAYMSSSSGGGGGGGGHKTTGGGGSNYGPGMTQETAGQETGQGQTEETGRDPGPDHSSIPDQIIQLIPKLGDSNFWQGVFVTAAAGLVGTAVFGKNDKNKRKDRKKEEDSHEDIQ